MDARGENALSAGISEGALSSAMERQPPWRRVTKGPTGSSVVAMTHSVIVTVVTAESEEQATTLVRDAFEFHLREWDDTRTGFDGPFDYGHLMKRGLKKAGADRWEEYQNTPLAFPGQSERGHTEIEQAWRRTWDSITQSLRMIREAALTQEDRALADNHLIRYEMSMVGAWYPEQLHHLFDLTKFDDGSMNVITAPGEFEDLIERLDEDAWAVPMDAHH